MTNCIGCGKFMRPFEEAHGDGQHCSPCDWKKIAEDKKEKERILGENPQADWVN